VRGEPNPTTDLRSPAFVLWILTAARVTMGIGIASLLAASVTILAFGAVETYRHIALLVSPE
jgi:hypothetical protein